MTREYKCVECRYCELRVDAEMGTRDYCTHKNCILSVDVISRPACEKFELPEVSGHWGP